MCNTRTLSTTLHFSDKGLSLRPVLNKESYPVTARRRSIVGRGLLEDSQSPGQKIEASSAGTIACVLVTPPALIAREREQQKTLVKDQLHELTLQNPKGPTQRNMRAEDINWWEGRSEHLCDDTPTSHTSREVNS
jgi:hypothetical protein